MRVQLMSSTQSKSEESAEKKVSIFTMIGSIFAAGFGVQSQANRERDFEHGKFHHFVIGGLIFVILFILVMVGVVKAVMHFAGV